VEENMCGIVGFRGNGNALEMLISSLEKLEYRGYDSAGIAYVVENRLITEKAVGRIQNLKDKLDFKTHSTMGIAHTRWATHGKPNLLNSHPHSHGKITVVHNGIIENYVSLKNRLIEHGYSFISDTDTEIIAVLLDSFYQETGDMCASIQKLFEELEGAYALGIICSDEMDTLYAVKKDSPLILAKSSCGNFIASDAPAILEYSDSYYLLGDYEFAKVTDDIVFFDRNGNLLKKEIQVYDNIGQTMDKGKYEFYMLKEIHEEPEVIQHLLSYYIEDNFKNLKDNLPDFSKYQKIHIVACGSAYHAGLIWKYLLEDVLNKEILVHLASEFRYQKLFLGKEVLTVFISQSGETADTLKALEIAHHLGSDTLAVVNVYASSIARGADFVLYTRAGSEIAVATTKGYTSQVMIGCLICAYLQNISISRTLVDSMKRLLERKEYAKVAKSIYKEKDIFFIGRGIDYALSMEGALKLKEISYIHAESYPAGELKHGTISLIDKGSYVFVIVTDERLKDKTISNLKEVVARGAKVILLIREDLAFHVDFVDKLILIPKVDSIFQALVTVLPLQLIAYEVAKLRGCDIDKPKNLAKSVTVE